MFEHIIVDNCRTQYSTEQL